MGDFRPARLFESGNIGVGPNDFRTVGAIELLYALAWVARDLAKRINRMREHARQNLHPIIGGAGLVGPLIAPTADDRSNLLRPIKLRNAKLAKIFRNPIQPR